jgi:hypothetical protein
MMDEVESTDFTDRKFTAENAKSAEIIIYKFSVYSVLSVDYL